MRLLLLLQLSYHVANGCVSPPRAGAFSNQKYKNKKQKGGKKTFNICCIIPRWLTNSSRQPTRVFPTVARPVSLQELIVIVFLVTFIVIS